MALTQRARILQDSPLTRPRNEILIALLLAVLVILSVFNIIRDDLEGIVAKGGLQVFGIGLAGTLLLAIIPLAILWFLDRREPESLYFQLADRSDLFGLNELAIRKWRVNHDGKDVESDPLVADWRAELVRLRERVEGALVDREMDRLERVFSGCCGVMLSLDRFCRFTVRFVLISVMTIALVLGLSAIAHSQLPALPTGAANNSLKLPDGVTRNGEYETAAIQSPLDNKVLFDITSPTIFNRDAVPDGKLPVEIRVQEVNERLWRVFYRTYKSKQTPTVTIATLNNRPVLEIQDDQTTRPLRFVTVTEPDADFNGKTLDKLAQEWQTVLQNEIIRFKELAAPETIRQRIIQAFQILLGLLIASAVIWLMRRILTRKQQTLEARHQQKLAEIAAAEKAQQAEFIVSSDVSSDRIDRMETPGEAANLRSQLLVALQHQFSMKRRLDLDKFLKWALFWIFIVMWYVGIARIVSIVPLLMRWSLYVWATPLVLLLIWFGISLAIRISNSLIDRLMHSWIINPLLPFGEAQRIVLRTTTIAAALKGFITVAFVMIGIISTLSIFNVSTSSIVAGGAVIGLAISFGSQSLVKDLVNGCLVLMEDQFAVGDVIQIGNKGGVVENFNLRVTQLRNSEGQLGVAEWCYEAIAKRLEGSFRSSRNHIFIQQRRN